MTSDPDVEYGIGKTYLFHCSCGATIETTEQKETCADCGAIIEVVRCVDVHHARKYTLKIRKRRSEWTAQPPANLAPLGTATIRHRAWQTPTPLDSDPSWNSVTVAQRGRRHHEVYDREKTFLRFGIMILLLVVFAAILYSLPEEKVQRWRALAANPAPSGCDWATPPVGDKHCHYEPIFHYVSGRGGEVTVTWYRIND